MIRFFKYYKWVLTYEQQNEVFLKLIKDLPVFTPKEIERMGKSINHTTKTELVGVVYPTRFRFINWLFKPKTIRFTLKKNIIFQYFWGSDFYSIYGNSFYWKAVGIINQTQDTTWKKN